MATGEQDGQTVTEDWRPVESPPIAGLAVKEIQPVAASSGYLTEIWRREWGIDDLAGRAAPYRPSSNPPAACSASRCGCPMRFRREGSEFRPIGASSASS
jgi:hypothetical protein